MIYLVIEYGRPQEIIPVMGLIRPAMVFTLLILLSWVLRGGISLGDEKQTKYMILLFIILVAHIPFARNNFWAYRIAKSFLMYFPLFLSITIYVNTLDRLKKLMNIWVGLMSYISINVILHGRGEGAGSNFLADENDYSLLLNMMVPFSFFLFLSEKQHFKKFIYALISILAVVSIVISFSRGGFVGLVCVGFIIWLYSPRKLATMSIVLIVSASIYYRAGDMYINEMGTITDTKESTSLERIELWKAGWKMFLDNPLGVGGGNYRVNVQDYQTTYFKRSMWGTPTHSLWVQLLSELGLFGVFIYISILVFNLKDIYKIKTYSEKSGKDVPLTYYLSLSFLASLVGYFSSGSFLSVLYYPHYYYVTAMIIATKRIIEKNEASEKCSNLACH